jgi:murein DD-endopeptidase MepM/ murein hydrolase activator NlpD
VRSQKDRLQRELSQTRREARAVDEELQVVDNRLQRIRDELDQTNARLNENRSRQEVLGERLTLASAKLESVTDQVRVRIRRMYLQPQGTSISAFLGARSMSQLLARRQIAEAIVRRDRRMFDDYRQLQREVREKKAEQDRLVREIHGLRQRQVGHKLSLADSKGEKERMLSGLRGKQEQLRRAIAQMERDEAAIASQIAALSRGPSRRLPPMVGRFLRPANGPITSGFGMRMHPILGYRRMHKGVDIAAGSGSPIYAAADGEVIRANYSSSYGNVVIIAHGSGLTTVYAHCSRLYVSNGQRVRRGQRIAAVGATGLAKGPHLHWEVYQNGRPVNPLGR